MPLGMDWRGMGIARDRLLNSLLVKNRQAGQEKSMKIEQMDTTKDGIKTYLTLAADKMQIPWHSQAAHKAAVGVFFLDMLGITDQADRDAVMKQWTATPSSFGCNSSAMGMSLGRPAGKEALEKTYAGF